jgi:hypothetical protein
VICGIAAIQIELGKPDWAKETLRKAEACYAKNHDDFNQKDDDKQNQRYYPVSALADIMIALGELDAARKLIEKDMPLGADRKSPLVHCYFAVVLAKSGDKTGAVDMLRGVMTAAEALEETSLYEAPHFSGLSYAIRRRRQGTLPRIHRQGYQTGDEI